MEVRGVLPLEGANVSVLEMGFVLVAAGGSASSGCLKSFFLLPFHRGFSILFGKNLDK